MLYDMCSNALLEQMSTKKMEEIKKASGKTATEASSTEEAEC
jgi:hypothetical protein